MMKAFTSALFETIWNLANSQQLKSWTLSNGRCPWDVFIRVPLSISGKESYIHIGVGSGVVCSTSMGNARASDCGIGNSDDSTLFLCPYEPGYLADIKISDMDALLDATTVENSSFGFTPTAIPEPQHVEKGVSVEYVPQEDDRKKWYLFRASYGREDLAAELLRKSMPTSPNAKKL